MKEAFIEAGDNRERIATLRGTKQLRREEVWINFFATLATMLKLDSYDDRVCKLFHLCQQRFPAMADTEVAFIHFSEIFR